MFLPFCVLCANSLGGRQALAHVGSCSPLMKRRIPETAGSPAGPVPVSEAVLGEAYMVVRFLAVLVSLFLALSSGALAASGAIETLDARGLQKLVQEQKGKPVVINFFATWCPPCRAEIPMLVDMHEKYRDKVIFLGLTVDDASSIAKVLPFATRMNIKYPIYRVGADVIQNFSIRSIPFNVGYDTRGKLAWAYSGLLDEDNFEQMIKELSK